jgi:hypothetical protein
LAFDHFTAVAGTPRFEIQTQQRIAVSTLSPLVRSTQNAAVRMVPAAKINSVG